MKNDTPDVLIPFNPQNGPQWLTFNYDTKKRQNNSLASILIEGCIKIKIKCIIPQSMQNFINNTNQTNLHNRMKLSNKSKLNDFKVQLKKNYNQQMNHSNIKHNYNLSYEDNISNFNLNEIKESNIPEIKKNHINTKKANIAISLHTHQTPIFKNRNIETPRSVNSNNINFNLYQRPFNKENGKHSNLSKIKEAIIDIEEENNTQEKINEDKNKGSYNGKSQEKKREVTVEKIKKENIKKEERAKENNNKNTSIKQKKNIINNKNKHVKNSNSNKKISFSEPNQKELYIEEFEHSKKKDINNNSKISNLSEQNDSYTKDILSDNENNIYEKENLELFYQLKTNFDLLYTHEYILSISNDLFRIEFDLLIEKIFELVLSYHSQVTIVKDKYRKIHKVYKEWAEKFLKLNNRIIKLQKQKEKLQIKTQNLNNVQGKLKRNLNAFNINKQEIKFLNCLMEPKNNKKILFKEIILSILTNHKNATNSLKKEHKEWFEKNISKVNVVKNKGGNGEKEDKEKTQTGSKAIRESEKRRNIINKKNVNANNVNDNNNLLSSNKNPSIKNQSGLKNKK